MNDASSSTPPDQTQTQTLLIFSHRNDSCHLHIQSNFELVRLVESDIMEQTRQNEPAQSSSMPPPTQEHPLPCADSTPRQSRYQRLMAALRPQSSTNTLTTVPYTSTPQTPAPARPRSAGAATINTTNHMHNLRARLHRLMHRSDHHHPRPHHQNHRFFSSLSIPRSPHHHASASSRARSHSHGSYDGADYDPYTVRGMTPPPAGPRDFAATSQQSNVWQRGQRRERRPEPDDGAGFRGAEAERWLRRMRGDVGQRSRRGGQGSTSMSTSSVSRTTSTMTSEEEDDDELELMGYPGMPMNYHGCGNGHGHGHGYQDMWQVDVHASGRVVGAPPHQRSSYRFHGPRPPSSRHGNQRSSRSRSGSTSMQQRPGTSFNLSFNHGAPPPSSRHRRSRSVMASHASSDARSRSASSVYSRGTNDDDASSSSSAHGSGDIDEEKEDEEDADPDVENDEASEADDAGGIPTRPRRPSASRSHSHASSLALRRWESSHPGSPYPSPFRPGLAALSRPRPAQTQQTTERKRRQKGRSGEGSESAPAVLTIGDDDDDDDDAYAKALAGSAMASASQPLLVKRSVSMKLGG